jgi:hypothetical protein
MRTRLPTPRNRQGVDTKRCLTLELYAAPVQATRHGDLRQRFEMTPDLRAIAAQESSLAGRRN